MQIIEVTWMMALKVWWSVTWRSLVFGFLAGAAIGLVFGFLGAMLGAPKGFHMFTTLLGFVAGVAVAIWAFKKVLYKRYSDFSIVCLSNASIDAEMAAQAGRNAVTPAAE